MIHSHSITHRGTLILISQRTPCPVGRAEVETFEIPVARMRELMPDLTDHMAAAEAEEATQAAARLAELQRRRADAARQVAELDQQIAQTELRIAAA